MPVRPLPLLLASGRPIPTEIACEWQSRYRGSGHTGTGACGAGGGAGPGGCGAGDGGPGGGDGGLLGVQCEVTGHPIF
jgi:hypothetical protein